MDIRPPRPRSTNAAPKPIRPSGQFKVPEELLESGDKEPLLSAHASKPKRFKNKKRWIIGILIVLAILSAAMTAGIQWWYNDALQPRSSSAERIKVVVEPGATPGQIADELQQKGVIKSAYAFGILIKQEGARDKLQAGAYLFSPKQSSHEVLAWLVEGKVDTFNVTILPGLTLAEIKQYLVKDGYKSEDIDAAFAKKYDHPLLASKPADINLEGYIYPDTYQISSQTTVEDLLIRSFDLFYKQIQAKGLEDELKGRGFTLHQGVTLASIIGKEVSNATDKRQVAQVFEKRLKEGTQLGSDVTYMYAAKLTGETPSPSLDSPYNTRLVKGLPPGAIANFSIDTLEAVADPAPGDYLYFVAGDDGTTHFSMTEAEHEDNIKKYCTKLCSE